MPLLSTLSRSSAIRVADVAASSTEAPRLTSIVVVARHALVRAGLRSVLHENPGLRVVGEACDLDEATRQVVARSPDVVLVNEVPSSTAVTRFRRNVPNTCVVSLDGKSGARDVRCVPADGGVAELCAMLGAVLKGRCSGCAFRASCPARAVAVALSPRETQVAVYVSLGLSSKQIAGALGISLRTVHTYRESLARKLGASSAAVLTRYVLEHQLAGSV